MRSFLALTFIAALSSAVAETTPPVKGTLCFAASKEVANCKTVDGESIPISAADAERRIVWSSADGKSAVVAFVPAKASSVDLRDKTLRNVTFNVHGDRQHGWPQDLRINVTDDKKNVWTWTVPAKAAGMLSQIRLPSGRVSITLGADHHVSAFRRLPEKGDVALREIDLRPMPVVSGRVMTVKDEPVANAQILRVDHQPVAMTDEQGSFRGEVGNPVPDSILVEKSGFGSLIVQLQPSAGDTDLGTLRLGSGVKLTVHVIRPEGNHDPLHVGLMREVEKKYDYTPMSAKDLAANDDTLVFSDLAKGKYVALVEGKGPLEKLTTNISVGESDLQQDIKIESYRLDGTAKIGDDPMNGTFGISMSRLRMDGMSLPIEDGHFSTTLWQKGQLRGWVQSKDFSGVEPVESPELGADPSTWNIQFPKRFIKGRIYDADSQQAISGASMGLLRTSGSNRLYSSIHLGEDGSYSILSTQLGTYELKVSAPEHVDMKQTIEVKQDDATQDHDFALTRGIAATLEVTWTSGVPAANAGVLEGVASDGHNAERVMSLDASGHLALRLERGVARTLYIVPMEGSFAVVHVTGSEQSDDKPIRVVVPDPAGSLKIAIATADGKPAAAGVGMRFNGEVIPSPVLTHIGMRSTPGMMDDRSLLLMPAGAYEVWPVSFRTYAPIGAAKSVSVSAGEMKVELVANP